MTNEQDLRNDEPLEVVAVAGPAEAQMIEEMLKNNGVDCTLQGDVVSTPWPTVSDLDEVRVLVRESDVSKAEELVDAFFSPVTKEELTEGDSDLGVEDPEDTSGFTISSGSRSIYNVSPMDNFTLAVIVADIALLGAFIALIVLDKPRKTATEAAPSGEKR
jgi:hypothetical protein